MFFCMGESHKHNLSQVSWADAAWAKSVALYHLDDEYGQHVKVFIVI